MIILNVINVSCSSPPNKYFTVTNRISVEVIKTVNSTSREDATFQTVNAGIDTQSNVVTQHDNEPADMKYFSFCNKMFST